MLLHLLLLPTTIQLLQLLPSTLSINHWGHPQQQSWPPFPSAHQIIQQQIPLQPGQQQAPSSPPAAGQSQQQQQAESYNEYLSKLSEYYNDFYTEYGSRYNEYLAKFSEWLKTSFGNNSNYQANVNSLTGSLPLPSTQGTKQGTQKSSSSSFHRHRPLCPSRNFPPPPKDNNSSSSSSSNASSSKNEGKNNGTTEPTFVHPLVLPVLHGNFSVRSNLGTETNLTAVDPLQQHLAMHSSVTLVVDHDVEGNKHIIVVDTGLAVLKHAILSGILANGIQPQHVDTVCITHPDTDTMGNLNLFPCAEVHSGNAISRENLFARQSPPSFESAKSELPFRRLFAHTELYLTPGLSFQDQSLVVRSVPDHGTVAIVGKLILNESDLANNLAIREFAIEDTEHRKLWQATRREIVCLADYIVPGYGVPFKVTAEVKRLADCGAVKNANTKNKKVHLMFGKKNAS